MAEKPALAPWTIKGVSQETRERIMRMARQDGLTVGQWLDRAAERQSARPPAEVIPPAAQAAEKVQDLAAVAASLQAFAALAQAGVPVSRGAIKDSVAVVRRHMRAERGLPDIGRPRGQTIDHQSENDADE